MPLDEEANECFRHSRNKEMEKDYIMNAAQLARLKANLGLARPIQVLFLFHPCPC